MERTTIIIDRFSGIDGPDYFVMYSVEAEIFVFVCLFIVFYNLCVSFSNFAPHALVNSNLSCVVNK